MRIVPQIFRQPEKKVNMKKIILFISILSISACGFKGDLYLPKENDKNQFGVIQTEWGEPNQSVRPPKNQEKTHD